MSAPDLLEPRHLMPFVYFGCELSAGVGERQDMLSGDDDLALWDHDAVDGPAIQDAGKPASDISPDYGIHDVERQADHVRQRRFGNNYRHFEFPPHNLREMIESLSDSEHKRNFSYTHQYHYQLSSLFQSDTEVPHSDVHSGTKSGAA